MDVINIRAWVVFNQFYLGLGRGGRVRVQNESISIVLKHAFRLFNPFGPNGHMLHGDSIHSILG